MLIYLAIIIPNTYDHLLATALKKKQCFTNLTPDKKVPSANKPILFFDQCKHLLFKCTVVPFSEAYRHTC